MKEFNYIIIDGGGEDLSLASKLELYDKLKNKSLEIMKERDEETDRKTRA